MSKKIMIIEDNAEIARSLEYVLSENGFTVATSDAGYDGLANAANDVPDLILLDLVMPGVSGRDVLDKVKDHPELKEVPIVIFSNLPQETDANILEETTAVDYFVKSETSPEELVSKLKQYLQ